MDVCGLTVIYQNILMMKVLPRFSLVGVLEQQHTDMHISLNNDSKAVGSRPTVS